MATETQEVRENNRLLIVGPSGCGKTTLALAAFTQYLEQNARDHYVTIHERPQHYDRGLSQYGFTKTLLNQQRWDAIAADADSRGVEPRQILAEIIAAHPRICFSIESINPDAQEKAVSAISYALLELGSGVLLVDEGYKFMPASRKQNHGLFNIVNGGRAEGIDAILVTPFRGDTTPLIIDGATMVAAFRQTTELDDKTASWFGDQRKAIGQLGDYEFMAKDMRGNVWREQTGAWF